MRAELHRWAVAGPGRRFDDLVSVGYGPAAPQMAVVRVAASPGADAPGGDGITAAWAGGEVGVPGFLGDLRAAPAGGWFGPLPVRERLIPKPGGSGESSAR